MRFNRQRFRNDAGSPFPSGPSGPDFTRTMDLRLQRFRSNDAPLRQHPTFRFKKNRSSTPASARSILHRRVICINGSTRSATKCTRVANRLEILLRNYAEMSPSTSPHSRPHDREPAARPTLQTSSIYMIPQSSTISLSRYYYSTKNLRSREFSLISARIQKPIYHYVGNLLEFKLPGQQVSRESPAASEQPISKAFHVYLDFPWPQHSTLDSLVHGHTCTPVRY